MWYDTSLIISTPNLYNLISLINFLKWIESNHEEHVVWYTYWLLYNFLKLSGFWIVESWFCYLDRRQYDIRRKINMKVSKIFPKFADTLLFVCKKSF